MTRLVLFLLCALVLEAIGVVLLSKGLKQIGELPSYTAVETAGSSGAGWPIPGYFSARRWRRRSS